MSENDQDPPPSSPSKRFLGLFPWPRRMRAKAEQLMRGLAISGASTLALSPELPGTEAREAMDFPPKTLTVKRERPAGMSRLVLRMGDAGAFMLNAGHRSHRSHSSHRSSSGGYSPPAPRTPAPVYSPPAPPPPAPPPESKKSSTLIQPPAVPPIAVPSAFNLRKEDIRRILVRITEVDLVKGIVKGADEVEMIFTFSIFSESQLLTLTPKEVIRTFGELQKEKPLPSSLKVGEKVVVDWWPDTANKKRVLIRMIAL
jgi:hypothetical protein